MAIKEAIVPKRTAFGVLFAPFGFWELSPDELKEVSNGAGPKGFGWIVPDTMYGLDISLAADIHDYMYDKKHPKDLSDGLFQTNLHAIIRKKGGWLEWLRMRRAAKYVAAVRSRVGDWCYED